MTLMTTQMRMNKVFRTRGYLRHCSWRMESPTRITNWSEIGRLHSEQEAWLMSGITLLKTDPFAQESPSSSSSPSKCLIVRLHPAPDTSSPPPTSHSLSFPSATAFCQAAAAPINDLINFLWQNRKSGRWPSNDGCSGAN